ncbi:Smg-4/UPF3 family-domain-containing protein [Cristinia sonorae]|uniref:Smg-4/UPF3 family-domain-containing protein n=1 Tax=Cristinia sonorae TaxID=1940300 RepID=A0A8K0XP84_9AGAR|nr:Smg-4/UPF3 family-domain-containing protein [Cristinia sonorae]
METRPPITISAAQPSRSSKVKEKEKEKEKKVRSSNKSQLDRLKTVVRRLPPNLPEEIFWQSVHPWVTEETVSWKVYYPGKFRKRLNKENIPSRAYIAFKDEGMLATFSREYDGHLFRDKAGNESIAVVEFAPFQKVPTEKKKVDGRLGTIDKDEDFLSFLESLKDNASKPFDTDTLETLGEYMLFIHVWRRPEPSSNLAAASHPPPQPTTTPLLEALKAERSAQKDKEAIIRAHAHYKDPAVAASASGAKKEEGPGKGKRGPPANAQKTGDATPGKKAAKATAKGKQQPAESSAAVPVPPKPAQNPNGSAPAQGGSKPAAKPTPKSPRRNRERRDSKSTPASAPAVAATVTVTAAVSSTDGSILPRANPTPATPVSTASGSSSAPAPVPTAGSTGQPPRRPRPVLGLASRHFEAALSGAGVDRKSKREQRERESKEKEGAASEAATPVTGTTPTILQRNALPQTPAILARPAQVEGDPAAPAPPGGREDNGGGDRGGGRGRGRGARRGRAGDRGRGG